MPDPQLLFDGSDFFAIGQDSYTQSLRLQNGEFVQGVNLMIRGGNAQTRPGTKTAFTMPDGNLQGSTLFQPTSGLPQLVFAVDGKVYTSPYPFNNYIQIPNLQFGVSSNKITWTQCQKSTDYDAAGVLIFVDNPYSVLVIQDGDTRAGYWDGTHSGHLNPTKSGLYTSGATGLSISAPPAVAGEVVIVVDPSDGVSFGQSITMGVAGVGSDTTTYQWFKDSVAISGETNSALTIASVSAGDAGDYYLTANDGTQSASSSVISLRLADLITTAPGFDETPIGLWMAWSNNRLWVSRGNQIFASDIGNPLKFTESQYLNEGRAFYLPGVCTGIVETPDQQGILAFTDTTGTFLLSSLQDRSQWLSTVGFQKTILPNIGCVSGRSIVHQYGMIWWYSSRGLMNLNSALQLNITSRLDIQDNEMFSTKYNMSFDLSGIAGSFFENLVVMSVPNGDKYNTQTMVLDQAPFEGNGNAWCGYWAGWRPVEWSRGIISGSERIFFSSIDYDGHNRMWEAMLPDKTDNGVPITSYIVTRPHLFGNRDNKVFKFAEIELQEVSGETSIMVAVAGLRGAFQGCLTKEMMSTNGQVYADAQYGSGGQEIAGSRPQTRVIRTQEEPGASDCNGACIESEDKGLLDKGFSIMIMWSGIAGVCAYRLFCRDTPNIFEGNCEDNETTDRLLTPEGCGIEGIFLVSEPFTTYTSTKTFKTLDPVSFLPVQYTATQSSLISQEDADNKAQIAAENYVLSEIGAY